MAASLMEPRLTGLEQVCWPVERDAVKEHTAHLSRLRGEVADLITKLDHGVDGAEKASDLIDILVADGDLDVTPLLNRLGQAVSHGCTPPKDENGEVPSKFRANVPAITVSDAFQTNVEEHLRALRVVIGKRVLQHAEFEVSNGNFASVASTIAAALAKNRGKGGLLDWDAMKAASTFAQGQLDTFDTVLRNCEKYVGPLEAIGDLVANENCVSIVAFS